MIITYRHIEPTELPAAPGLVRIDIQHPEYPEICASYYAARKNLRHDYHALVSRFVTKPNSRLRKWFDSHDLDPCDYRYSVHLHDVPGTTPLNHYDKEHLLLLQAISCRIHDHQLSLLINSWLPGKRRCPVQRTAEHRANISKALQGYYNWSETGRMVLLDGTVIEGNHRQLAAEINVTPATVSNWLRRGEIPSIWRDVLYFKGRNGTVVLHAAIADDPRARRIIETLSLDELADLGRHIQSCNAKHKRNPDKGWGS